LCGHRLYINPKEGAGAPPSPGPGSAPVTQLGRVGRGHAQLAWCKQSGHTPPGSAFLVPLAHAGDLAVCGMCKQMVFKRSGWKDI